MGAQNKGYKRSWKNLLINKRYQLRFTLFMVGLSALLMLGLGFWVLHKAGSATTITRNHIEDRPCGDEAIKNADSEVSPDDKAKPKPGSAAVPPAKSGTSGSDSAGSQPGATGENEKPAGGASGEGAGGTGDKPLNGTASEEPAGAAETAGATGEAGEPSEAGERPRRKIQVEVGEMKLDPKILAAENKAAEQAESALSAMDVARCVKERDQQLKELDQGYRRIQIVLIVAGLLLVIGLTIFGIKMTHRVAGPLYKVSLYLEKMRKGTYDEVYNLRKGDQLVEFYEQFKNAHTGLKSMQQQDIEVLRDILDAAEKAELGSKSPELDKLMKEMRETLAGKEESIA